MEKGRGEISVAERFKGLELNWHKELQDIINLAVQAFDAPIAVITLQDRKNQLIKANYGIDAGPGAPRISFCDHLAGGQVLVVKDASKDRRFLHDPMVTGGALIRFYAGAPLLTHDGQQVGSLCVMDKKPRRITPGQEEVLKILARQVMHLLELELSSKLLRSHIADLEKTKSLIKASETKLLALFNSSSTCHMLIDSEYRLMYFNKAARQFIKETYGKEAQEGSPVKEYISRKFLPHFVRMFRKACKGITSHEQIHLHYTNRSVWWDMVIEPACDSEQNIIGVSFNATNINQQKEREMKILQQYKALQKVAHIQSHGFRRPVASILGLMNLIRSENYKATKEELRMLERAVNELDDHIRTAVMTAEGRDVSRA